MADECPHCEDGHEKPWKAHWGAYVDVYKDGDGQPTIISVMKTGSQHVAESDAQWVREKIMGQHTPAEMLDWLDWMADDLRDQLPGLDAIAAVLREQITEALVAKAKTDEEKEDLRRRLRAASPGPPPPPKTGGATTGRITGATINTGHGGLSFGSGALTKDILREMNKATERRNRYGR